jgi:opacity protein-like surface antigen
VSRVADGVPALQASIDERFEGQQGSEAGLRTVSRHAHCLTPCMAQSARRFRFRRPSMNPIAKLAVAPVCAALLAATSAIAQSQSSRSSYIPYTSGGYVGLGVGKPDYRLDCTPGFNCDDPNTSFHLYTGASFNDWLGLELGYSYLGKADRQGGTTRGHGINLSLVGSVPLSQSFKLFGKVGTTYGRTTISANPLSLEPTGDDSGWGRSFGAGVEFNFTPQWGLVAGWDRQRMKFVGDRREDIDAASIGVRYHY